jgi:uncharacterized protein
MSVLFNCMYAADRTGAIHRAEIHHHRWPLQRAEAQIEVCTVTEAWRTTLPEEPL